MKKHKTIFLSVLALITSVALVAGFVSSITHEPTTEATLKLQWYGNKLCQIEELDIYMEDLVYMETYGFQAFLNYDKNNGTFLYGEYTDEPFYIYLVDPIYEDEYGVIRMSSAMKYEETHKDALLARLYFNRTTENPVTSGSRPTYVWFDTNYTQHPLSVVPVYIGGGEPGEIPDIMKYIDSEGYKTVFEGY